MTKDDLEQNLFLHGCIKGVIEGERTEKWGVITLVEKYYINFVDHFNHFHIFKIKDVQSFTPEKFRLKK